MCRVAFFFPPEMMTARPRSFSRRLARSFLGSPTITREKDLKAPMGGFPNKWCRVMTPGSETVLRSPPVVYAEPGLSNLVPHSSEEQMAKDPRHLGKVSNRKERTKTK